MSESLIPQIISNNGDYRRKNRKGERKGLSPRRDSFRLWDASCAAPEHLRKPPERQRDPTARRRRDTCRGDERHHGAYAQDLEGRTHLKGAFAENQPPAPETEPMILIIGRNMATTIVPTTTARTMISAGSIAAVMPATALSTSSS